MSTAPQPPQPPIPPQPPRAGSHIVAIVLLILALIVLVAGLAVWTGLRFLSHTVRVHVEQDEGGKKEVSIETPVGSFGVAKGVDETRLGLPIYPGAKQVRDDGASLNMQWGGEEGVRLVVGKFETPDPFDAVKDFYQQRVGKQVTKFTEKDSEGKTVFEIKRKDEEKVVALKRLSSGTRIDLVRVVHRRAETN